MAPSSKTRLGEAPNSVLLLLLFSLDDVLYFRSTMLLIVDLLKMLKRVREILWPFILYCYYVQAYTRARARIHTYIYAVFVTYPIRTHRVHTYNACVLGFRKKIKGGAINNNVRLSAFSWVPTRICLHIYSVQYNINDDLLVHRSSVTFPGSMATIVHTKYNNTKRPKVFHIIL